MAVTHNLKENTNLVSFIHLICYPVYDAVVRLCLLPLFHFLFHVNALFLQQLPLGEGPVHGLGRGFGTWGPLPLSPGLDRVVEPEHMALPQDDAISFTGIKKIEMCLNV